MNQVGILLLNLTTIWELLPFSGTLAYGKLNMKCVQYACIYEIDDKIISKSYFS